MRRLDPVAENNFEENKRVCSMTRLERLVLSLTLLATFDSNAFAQSPIITTYAGRSIPISGVPAIAQPIRRPVSVISDGNGGFYMASEEYVARVTANGVLTVIAGNGTPVSRRFNGDHGPVTAVLLDTPADVAVDAAGNLFIAGDHRIRKVTADGVINTIAGNGTPGFNGDGGLAASAALNEPSGIAVDSQGNIFFADTGNHRVRQLATESVVSFSIIDRGGMSLQTPGIFGQIRMGSAHIEPDDGRPAPSGLAMSRLPPKRRARFRSGCGCIRADSIRPHSCRDSRRRAHGFSYGQPERRGRVRCLLLHRSQRAPSPGKHDNSS
jgi:hypothetical protein